MKILTLGIRKDQGLTKISAKPEESDKNLEDLVLLFDGNRENLPQVDEAIEVDVPATPQCKGSLFEKMPAKWGDKKQFSGKVQVRYQTDNWNFFFPT